MQGKIKEREREKKTKSIQRLSRLPVFAPLLRKCPGGAQPRNSQLPLRKRGSGVGIPKLNYRIMSELLYEVRAEGGKDPLLVISALSCAPLFMAKPVT